MANRLCGALADPIVHNARWKRQLALIAEYVDNKEYNRTAFPSNRPLTEMKPGTYCFRMIIVVGDKNRVNEIPVDGVIQPKTVRDSKLPILINAKSAGDFTSVNKRREEEVTQVRQLKARYGDDVECILFLCGYFDSGYLGYEASEGIGWIWEHRRDDMDELGL